MIRRVRVVENDWRVRAEERSVDGEEEIEAMGKVGDGFFVFGAVDAWVAQGNQFWSFN